MSQLDLTQELGPRPPRRFGLNAKAVWEWEVKRIMLSTEGLRKRMIGATAVQKALQIEALATQATLGATETARRGKVGQRCFIASRSVVLIDQRDCEPQLVPTVYTTPVRIVKEGHRGNEVVPTLSNILSVQKTEEPLVHIPLTTIQLDAKPENVIDNIHEVVLSIWEADQLVDLQRNPLKYL